MTTVSDLRTSKILEPLSFISEKKSFETYAKDLKRWALLTSVAKEKQALIVLLYLDVTGFHQGLRRRWIPRSRRQCTAKLA